ncbi:hypothetical protein C2G38_2173430 [Gigaspora rosea]|uniref:Uncharacterized protein n=1 Tax=Gigaspora rosea TaxID=44941 RepID=A0A397VJJ2_9GLOM|nr:hypothetical protein C2G38_2173430 [Gigaspora rosea]
MPAPLTLMLSLLDDIINTCSQEASIMSYLQIIQCNACRLLKLINALLQYSNIESENYEACLDYVIDIPLTSKFNQDMGDKVYIDYDMYSDSG